ncbi:hypothetical protein [Streptomyces sp. NPDC047009]|uniref:hypothetical protein n=1 Tax=Streptomyces sp. NPDC047009 TaxID=3154496 RepID=UPI0033C66679
MALGAGREIYAELHHAGTLLLAANLSWHARRNSRADESDSGGLLVRQDYVGACCLDICTTALELARRLQVDSGMQLTATIAAAPTVLTTRLTLIVTDPAGFTDIPDYARHPHRVQPVTAVLTPADTDAVLLRTTQELFTDLMNQFGLDPQM